MSVPSAAVASRTGRSTALTGLVWLLLAGVLVRSVWLVLDSSIDLDVYRLGGMAVVDRHGFDDELYGPGLSPDGDGGLPFTYPPFAALLFVPLAFLPERLTELALGLASIGVAAVLIALFFVTMPLAPRSPGSHADPDEVAEQTGLSRRDLYEGALAARKG